MIYSVDDIKTLKEKVKPELFGHPLFEKQCERAYKYMSELTGRHSFDFVVWKDGNGVTVKEQYVSKDKNPIVGNNSELTGISLVLEEDGGLVVDTSVGTAFNVNDYIECVCRGPEKQFDFALRNRMNDELKPYSSILSTFYSRSAYDANGIEMSSTIFSDTYPLTRFRVGDPLDEQVLSELHKPPRVSHNMGPEMPIFVGNGSYTHTYRFYENLGLAYTFGASGVTKIGSQVKKEETTVYQSTVGTEYPETLSYTDERFAVAVLNPDTTSHDIMIGTGFYEGVPLDEIKKEVALGFEKQIESSRTKQNDPKTFEVLKQIITTNNAKYTAPQEDILGR